MGEEEPIFRTGDAANRRAGGKHRERQRGRALRSGSIASVRFSRLGGVGKQFVGAFRQAPATLLDLRRPLFFMLRRCNVRGRLG